MRILSWNLDRWTEDRLTKLHDPNLTRSDQVIDRTDGKLVHLDGLNFSRAWCLYSLAQRLAGLDSGLEEVAARLIRTGDTHIR